MLEVVLEDLDNFVHGEVREGRLVLLPNGNSTLVLSPTFFELELLLGLIDQKFIDVEMSHTVARQPVERFDLVELRA